MENVKNIYWGTKGDYNFNVLHIEEHKNSNDTYFIKISEYCGHVHNCGPNKPHIVHPTYSYNDVTNEMRTLLYEDTLKNCHQISKENYDKIAKLYDNYHKVFVETGRKIKKLIKSKKI